MNPIQVAKRLAPQWLKDKLRSNSVLRSAVNRSEAQHFSVSSKRIDVCSAQICHAFMACGLNGLVGKRAIECGSGWVLSHSLVFHLMGAKEIVATDIEELACPEMLINAIRSSEASIPIDTLAQFDSYEAIYERYQKLVEIKSFNFKTLESLGIHYVAPHDFAIKHMVPPADFMFSNSVMEHVPVNVCQDVLTNMAASLAPNGTMIHRVHLEDHHDCASNPWGFFDQSNYDSELQTRWGNRIRPSQWREMLDTIPDSTWRFFYGFERWNKPLPNQIDADVQFTDEKDLRCSHIGICLTKNA